MHLSLKGSLDRQPLTDRLGDRLLAEYGGAAAAYSLRALNGNGESVVRVRRASDNSENDFTALQVSSGEMVNWVNAQIVPPLDIRELDANGERTGALVAAAAAYSLRNLSASYTGNVVDVRRSSDDTVASFTAEEVSDGTMVDWVTAPLNGLIGNRMYFDGADDRVEISNTEIENITFTTIFTGVTTARSLFFGSTTSHVIVTDPSGRFGLFVGSYLLSSFSPSIGVTYTINLQWNGSGYDLTVNGASEGAISSSKISINSIGRGFNSVSGLLYDVTINEGESNEASYQGYGNTDADWEDQSGSNNGTVLGSPVIFTGQSFDLDGHVSQWYDQSGNANHATQGTPASQPKIVDGGSLVTGGLDFSSGDYLVASSVSGLEGSLSMFCASVRDFTGTPVSLSNSSSGSRYFGILELAGESSANPRNTSNVTVGDSVSGSERLTFAVTTGATSTSVGAKGSAVTTTTDDYGDNFAGSNIDQIAIGLLRTVSPTSLFDGLIREIIVYNSDQSSNRTAIEANIGETYGIDLPSGVDTGYDEVDGFVETWYDQSGNGNDATQSVAGNQPKIVDAGALVSGGIDFDGVDDHLDMASGVYSLANSADKTMIVVSKSDATGAGNRRQIFMGAGVSTRVSLWKTSDTSNAVSFNGFANAVTVAFDNTNQFLTYSEDLSGTQNFYINGGNLQTNALGGTNNDVDTAEISNDRNIQNWSGIMGEIILYESDQSANRVAIETNINDYYNIY